MVWPSGEQLEIVSHGYRAVVTEGGGALRSLSHDDRDLVDPFPVDRPSSGGRGQLLVPWPNRIGDGRYSFGGREHQLGLSEPRRHNASHGLVRWAAWTVAEHTADAVTLTYRLMAQSGYPWTLDVEVRYRLDADGLHVTQSAANRAAEAAPYASGAHPYLRVGDAIEGLELTLPARTRLLVDHDRLLPTGAEPVAGTAYDFTTPRVIGDTELDDGFGDLTYDAGRATARLRDPATGQGVELWVDERHRWLQVYTPEDCPGPRPAIAVEPMTAPVDAFRSGTDLVTLAPAGSGGDTFSATWGLRALG
jgi:aldose 1-epimerase